MLAYSYGILKQGEFAMLGQEEFENIYDLLSEILIKGIEIQLKRGLYKEYLPIEEPLSVVRGKIDINESIKLKTRNSMQLYCQYDEFSSNTTLNQILKAVCKLLMKCPKLSKEKRSKLKVLWGYFQEVDEISLKTVQWSKLHYHKNNLTYKMLMNICYLIVEGLLVTEETGKNKFLTFIKDKQMAALYEKFVYEFFKQECPQLEVRHQEQIKWDTDDGYIDLLPTMHSDITLTKGRHKLIIDTKFYRQMMQKSFYSENKSFISSNLYQIYAYVKNSSFNKVGDVSGMLLYPVIDDKYDEKYHLGGNTVYVRTIDLGRQFEEIRKHLLKISYIYKN